MKGSIHMSDLQKYKQKQLKDPAFRAEYELTRPEFEVMRVLIDARISQNMTQKELSEKSGVRQSNISRIENESEGYSLLTCYAVLAGIIASQLRR